MPVSISAQLGAAALGSLELGRLSSASQGLVVKWSPSTNPLDTPSWVDITDRVMHVTLSRGRQFELNRMEAGTATLVLDNSDRTFDPLYADGEYYPNVLPLKKFQILVTSEGVTTAEFTGYVEAWPQTWEGTKWSEVEITLVDGFEALSLATVVGSLSQEYSGVRIGHVLDNIGWPSTDRNLDTGQTQVAAITIDATSQVAALSHINDVENSELGYVFMSKDGTVTYHDRAHRSTNTRSTTSQATFGDAESGELPYVEIVPSFDKQYIYNWVAITPAGSSTAQIASDSGSITQYMKRAYSQSTQLTSTADALSQAQYVLGLYKQPSLRWPTLTVKPVSDTNLWSQVVALDIGDRVTVNRRPENLGTLISTQNFIERITWVIDPPFDVQVTYELSPVLGAPVLILDDATYGVLDSTNTLGW